MRAPFYMIYQERHGGWSNLGKLSLRVALLDAEVVSREFKTIAIVMQENVAVPIAAFRHGTREI